MSAVTEPKTFFLLMGRRGEYSERVEWPVALYENEADARAVAERAAAHAREQKARICHWYVTIWDPWSRAHPDGEPISEMPTNPLPQINPDDPEHEPGDDYWVEVVSLRDG